MEMNSLVAAHLQNKNQPVQDMDEVWVPDFSVTRRIAARVRALVGRLKGRRASHSAAAFPAE